MFKGVGDAQGTAAAAAEKYAGKLSAQTGVDDELIMKGQAVLATFHSVSGEAGRTAGIFDRATAAGADLAAAGFGSIESNAVQLGKALEDPTKGMTALAKSGVTFTDAQKASIEQMQKSGDLLGAQQVILGAVEGQVKGTAEATATSSEKMRNSWGNAQESIGTTLLPAIESISKVLGGVFDYVSQNASWLVPIVGSVVAIAGALFVAGKAVTAFKTALEGVKLAVGGVKAAWALLNLVFAASPIGLIIVAVIAVIAILVVLYLKVDWFRNAVDAALQAVVGVFSAAWDAIVAGFNWFVAFIKQWGELFLAVLLGPFYLVFKLIQAAVTGGWSGIVNTISGWAGTLGRILSGIGEVVAAPFRAAWGLIQSYLLNPLVNAFNGVVGAIRNALSGVTNAITAPFSAAWSWIDAHVLGPLKGGWNAVARAINSVHISVAVPDWVPGIGGKGFDFDPPNVPMLAAGGLMTRTGLVYAHVGEVITPAPAVAALGRSGPAINIEHATFAEPVDVELLLRKAAFYMQTARV